MRDLWVEKYRPNTTQGYVFRDQAQKDQVQEWIDSGAIPHLLFSGVQGAGKTTLAKLLINELGTHEFDVRMINASSNNGVDYIRDSVEAFATVMPYGDFKYIILDECLDENTEVVVLRDNTEHLIKIKDLDDENDLVKSYNVEKERVEWKPFVLFDKEIQGTLEIEFDNNEVVICTPDHKWYVDDNGETKVVKASDLHLYGHILTT